VEIAGNARISGVFKRDIPELPPAEGSYNIIPDRPDAPPFKGVVTLEGPPQGM
jgi:hypothetical protein